MSVMCGACLIAQVALAASLRTSSCCHGIVLRLLWACVHELLRPHVSRLDGIVNGRLATMLAMSQLLAAGHAALYL